MAAAILRQHRRHEAVLGFAPPACSLQTGAKQHPDPADRGLAVPRDCGIATPPLASVVQGADPAVKQTHFVCSDDRALPLYGSMKDAPEGLYLGLLHGRNHLHTHLDKLGYPGPAIGPLRHVRTSYAAHLYLRFADWKTTRLFFPDACATPIQDSVIGLQDEIVIDIVDSTIPYDGRFFGDWTVFYHGTCVGEPHARCG